MKKLFMAFFVLLSFTAYAQSPKVPFRWETSQAKKDSIKITRVTQLAFTMACEKIVRSRLKKQGFSVADVRFSYLESYGAIPQKSTFSNGAVEWLWSSWGSFKFNNRWVMARFSCMYNQDNGVYIPFGSGDYSTLIPPERRR
jgi:hypothetical protein